jgi:hypothetical protein
MGVDSPRELAGSWELVVDLPGAEDVRGQVVFEAGGRSSCNARPCRCRKHPTVLRHRHDRGRRLRPALLRLPWRRTISDDGTTIEGEWRTSGDGQWQRDFGLTYTRVA